MLERGSQEAGSTGTAARLREEFDAAFAREQHTETTELVDLLLVRVGDQLSVFRLLELEALHARRVLVPAPSQHRALLGLAGFRGAVAPVYDLGQLLGLPPTRHARWIGLARSRTPIAFAFEHFERHVRVPTGDLRAAGADAARFVSGSLVWQKHALPILHVPALIAAVAESAT